MISNRKVSGNISYSFVDRLERTIKPRCERPLPPLQLRENGCKLVKNYNPFRRTPKTVRRFSYERAPALTERSPADEKVLEVLPMDYALISKESSVTLTDIRDEENLVLQTDKDNSERSKGKDEKVEVTAKIKESNEKKEMQENSKTKVDLTEVQSLLSSEVLFLG